MAVGDLLTADWQWELDSTSLFGTGQNGVWIQLGQSIEGLGAPDAKTADVPLYGRDGAAGNPDFNDVRIILIPALLRGTPAVTGANMKALAALWAPVEVDVTLALQLPGWGQFYVNGRPRGCKPDTADFNRITGLIRTVLRFDCLDPTMVDIP